MNKIITMFDKFQKILFKNPNVYELVKSKILPDPQPPSDIPITVVKITKPTLSATWLAGKNFLIISAYDGTIPPCDKPNNIETIYKEFISEKGMNKNKVNA